MSIQLNKQASMYNVTAWASAAGAKSRGPPATWIFIHGTDNAEGGLIVLFFGLVFSVASPPPPFGNFSPDALA